MFYSEKKSSRLLIFNSEIQGTLYNSTALYVFSLKYRGNAKLSYHQCHHHCLCFFVLFFFYKSKGQNLKYNVPACDQHIYSPA